MMNGRQFPAGHTQPARSQGAGVERRPSTLHRSGQFPAESARRLGLCLVPRDEGELVIAGEPPSVLDGHGEVDGVERRTGCAASMRDALANNRLGTEHQQRQGSAGAGAAVGIEAGQHGARVRQALGPSGGVARSGELQAGHKTRYNSVLALQELEPK